MSTEKTKTNPLMAMLAQYEQAASNSKESTYDKKDYFSIYIPDGVDSATKRIRIIPTNDQTSPLEEVYFHSKTVDGNNRKFACISKMDDEDCPFCEIKAKLLSSGDKSEEELAKKFSHRLYYVVKVIDRDDESHGPKFWRFPINYKKEGIFDKISAIAKMYMERGQDILDSENGRDLILNIQRVKNPKGGSYPTVNTIIADDKSPLSEDSELMTKWIEDKRTWRDVYSIKPYDYLYLVATGKVPAWDKVKECWVDKETLTDTLESENETSELDEQITMGSKKTTSNDLKVEEPKLVEASVDYDDDDEDDDDLPF